jgi:hypothetical protein
VPAEGYYISLHRFLFDCFTTEDCDAVVGELFLTFFSLVITILVSSVPLDSLNLSVPCDLLQPPIASSMHLSFMEMGNHGNTDFLITDRVALLNMTRICYLIYSSTNEYPNT